MAEGSLISSARSQPADHDYNGGEMLCLVETTEGIEGELFAYQVDLDHLHLCTSALAALNPAGM